LKQKTKSILQKVIEQKEKHKRVLN